MILDPVVILANGNYPTHPIPVQKINEAGSIICCDGAANQLTDKGLEPSMIIGDLDSTNQALNSKYHDQTIHLPDQNENDLRKAIRWVEDKGIQEITILGATGKRDDHSIANIFTLLQFSTKMKCTVVTNYGCFTSVEGSSKFQSFAGQQVSLFSADPEISITSTNLKYSLNKYKLINLYSGSLNESLSEIFTLTISHGKLLVYQVFA